MFRKVWFITGASRGFGALIVRDALARGDFVVAAARDMSMLDDEHPNLLALPMDVSREAAAIVAVQRAINRFGRIDVLVNNASQTLLGAVEEASVEEVRRQYETNVFGLLNVCRAALPYMRRQRSGRVINISSLGGYSAHYGWGIYDSSKFAVEGLSEAMAAELAPLGIHVTVVEPGFFRTGFMDSPHLMKTAAMIEDYAETAGAMRSFAAQAGHRQPGDPDKFARAILTLADLVKPPVRLQLGADAVARVREKNRAVALETAEWLDLALSTDLGPACRAA